MNQDQIALLQQSWKMVRPMGDEAMRMFYDRLFEIDGSAVPLFANVDMRRQRQKLLGTIGLAVDNLTDFYSLAPVLEQMGKRHAGYGVRDHHYESVGAALLWTLEQGLGEAWTPELRDAWTDAYLAISSTMLQGAEAARETA